MEYAFNKIRRAVLIEKINITSINQCMQILEQEFYGSDIYESRQFGLTYFYVKNNRVILEAQLRSSNPSFYMLFNVDTLLSEKQSKSYLKEKFFLFFINFFNIECKNNGTLKFNEGSDIEYVRSSTKKIYTHNDVN